MNRNIIVNIDISLEIIFSLWKSCHDYIFVFRIAKNTLFCFKTLATFNLKKTKLSHIWIFFSLQVISRYLS